MQEELDLFEKDRSKELMISKEVERTGIDGGVKAIKSLLEIPTSIIDGAANTNLNSKLDSVTRNFLQEHGDPETLGGEIGSVLTQYGSTNTIAFKILGNASVN